MMTPVKYLCEKCAIKLSPTDVPQFYNETAVCDECGVATVGYYCLERDERVSEDV